MNIPLSTIWDYNISQYMHIKILLISSDSESNWRLNFDIEQANKMSQKI